LINTSPETSFTVAADTAGQRKTLNIAIANPLKHRISHPPATNHNQHDSCTEAASEKIQFRTMAIQPLVRMIKLPRLLWMSFNKFLSPQPDPNGIGRL
jgi:hypothetical protein